MANKFEYFEAVKVERLDSGRYLVTGCTEAGKDLLNALYNTFELYQRRTEAIGTPSMKRFEPRYYYGGLTSSQYRKYLEDQISSFPKAPDPKDILEDTKS